jgi:hypothetical protein
VLLAGVPLLEPDHAGPPPHAGCDVASAALLRAVVHRFGPRGLSATVRQGIGAAAVDAPDQALVVRALIAEPIPLATRAGEAGGDALATLEAILGADFDARGLDQALQGLHARAVSWPATLVGTSLGGLGSTGIFVRVEAPLSAVEGAASALVRAGASSVAIGWIEERRPGVAIVTVPIGAGTTKQAVRMRVVKDGGVVVHVEPELGDVRAAAERSGRPAEAVRAEAFSAWERLGELGGAAIEAGLGGKDDGADARARRPATDDDG